MSLSDTYIALTNRLVSQPIAGIDPLTDIDFDNNSFNPAGKSQFLSCFLIPATSEMLGKSSVSSNDDRGIFQVSVFTKRNPGDYINGSLDLVDSVRANFVYNTSLTYNNQKVDILDSDPGQPRETDGWFQQDISINYLTFSQRG